MDVCIEYILQTYVYYWCLFRDEKKLWIFYYRVRGKNPNAKSLCLLALTSSHFKTQEQQAFSLFSLNDMSGYPKPKGWVPATDF